MALKGSQEVLPSVKTSKLPCGLKGPRWIAGPLLDEEFLWEIDVKA